MRRDPLQARKDEFDRAEVAIHLLERGQDFRTIKELLGHSHMDTTMIYTHALKRSTGVLSPLDDAMPVSQMAGEP